MCSRDMSDSAITREIEAIERDKISEEKRGSWLMWIVDNRLADLRKEKQRRGI